MGSDKCNLLKTLTRSYLQERNQGILNAMIALVYYLEEVCQGSIQIGIASAAICWTIHHILPDIALWSIYVKKIRHWSVIFKNGGGVIDAACQSSIQNVVWNHHCRLSFHSSSDAWAASGLPCSDLFVFPSSHGFSRKKETTHSLQGNHPPPPGLYQWEVHHQRPDFVVTHLMPNFTFFFSTIKSQIYLTLSVLSNRMSCPLMRSNKS